MDESDKIELKINIRKLMEAEAKGWTLHLPL